MKGLRKLILNLAVLFTFAPGFSQAAHAQNQTVTFDFASKYFGGYDVPGTLMQTPTSITGSITIPSNPAGFTPGTYSFDGVGGFFILFSNDQAGPGYYGVLLALYPSPYGNAILEDSSEHYDYGILTIAAVPELSSMLGLGSFVALGGFLVLRRRKQAHNAT